MTPVTENSRLMLLPEQWTTFNFLKFHCLSPLRICPRNHKYTLALSTSIYSVKLNVLRPSFIGTSMKCYIAFTLSSSVSNHESKDQQKTKAQRQRHLTGFHLKSLSISAAIFFFWFRKIQLKLAWDSPSCYSGNFYLDLI